MKTMIAACAITMMAVTPAFAQEAEEDGGSSCVRLRNINGYSVIDNQHLLLNGGVSDHYLVTTRTRCSGMRFGVQIGTSFDDNASICPPFLEYIIPDDGWRCAIESIEEVEDLEAARALIAERAEAEAEDES